MTFHDKLDNMINFMFIFFITIIAGNIVTNIDQFITRHIIKLLMFFMPNQILYYTIQYIQMHNNSIVFTIMMTLVAIKILLFIWHVITHIRK